MSDQNEIDVKIRATTADLTAGLKQAQASIVRSTDAMRSSLSGLGVASAGATREMGMWGALQAEAAGHVGEHSLSIGRLERSLEGAASAMAGINPVVGLLSTSLLKFGIGSIETVGILAGVAAIGAVFDVLTESSRKTMEASDKAIESLLKMQELDSLGFGAKFQEDIAAMTKAIPVEKEWSKWLTAIANGLPQLGSIFGSFAAAHNKALADMPKAMQEAFKKILEETKKGNDALEKSRNDDLVALVTFNAGDAGARGAALTQIAKYNADLAKLGEGEYAARAEIIRRIQELEAPFKAEQRKTDADFQKTINKLAGLGHIDAASVVEHKHEKDTAAEEKALAFHTEMEAKTLELTFRTIDEETKAKLAANDAEYMRRQLDIANDDTSEKTKTANYLANAQLRAAGEAEIRRKAAEKKDEEQKRAEEKEALALERQTHQWEQFFSSITNAFEQSVNGIVQGTTTMAQALKNIWKSITAELITQGVKAFVHHRAMELAKTGATAQGAAQRVALETGAAIRSVAIGAWAAIARITQYAVEGAAAAFKSIAAIPIVGPFLAPAAAVAAGLAIGSFAGRIASAEGGYDIPSGLNPVTQLHQNEMVLPAALANKVRNMTDGAGSGNNLHLHVHAMDSKGVKQFLHKHKDHLVDVLNGATRDFQFGQ